jgi:3'(2'), 5'-bisphosphate nucleotidase
MTETLVLTEKERGAALLAVAEAAIVCRAVQQKMDDVRSLTKDDRSPVTVADFASQAVVARRLREALGDVPLVAEEASEALRKPDHSAVLLSVVDAVQCVWPGATAGEVVDAIDLGDDDGSGERFWTLDPIDGTKGFLRGGQYAVSLGLISGASPIAGFLACPNMSAEFGAPFDEPSGLGQVFQAIAGQGVSSGGGVASAGVTPKIAPISRSERGAGEPVRMCESVEAAHSKHDAAQQVLERIGLGSTSVRLDSQAKYAVVARGQADVYLRMPTRKGYVERIWDHAAGALCATEAGCVVTDITGAALDFSHGRGLETNRGIICADAGLHGRIVQAIADLGLQ